MFSGAKKTLNLTGGNVFKVLLLYSLPLFGSAVIQQVYSLADFLIVGNFAKDGQAALTAVGEATTVVNVLLSFALGANGGCSVVVAKHFGKVDNVKVKETVNTALIAFSVLCLVTMAMGFALCLPILKAMSVEEQFMADSTAYLYIYTGSLPFVFLYNLGCGISSSLGDSKTPFLFLVFSSVLNVVLDLIFVLVLHWDVAGAAWATFISQAIASVLTGAVIFKKLSYINVNEKVKKFDKTILKDLTATTVPIILQQSFVSVGNVFVMNRINVLGKDAAAGFTAAFKLICMANMGVSSLTNGLANFVSQNRAAGNKQRIKQGFVAVFLYAVTTSIIFLSLFIGLARPLSKLFIDNPTEGAIESSVRFLTVVSCFLPAVCLKIVSDGVLRGCGRNLGFTLSTCVDLALRVAFVYILTACGLGFNGVCYSWAIGWSVSMVVSIIFYLCIKELRKVKYFGT